MATFILIHGAWHGGWCWEKLVPLLEARGHRALAPDLAGMGNDRRVLGEGVLALWADEIADLVRQQEEPVILVGHSRGGIVISEVAERVPDHVARLVYLTAYLVPPGEAALAVSLSQPGMPDLRPMLTQTADGRGSYFASGGTAPLFYHQVDPALVPGIEARLCPEPHEPVVTPLMLTAERFGRVPRSYVEAGEDKALIPALQRAMRERMPCESVLTLPSDHSPFYSMPERLADALIGLAG
ncbi:alpha/beta fold hydrolase [Sphingobium sp. Sx8-8]|uniref:alpha/beta fold hydrolase n=1 Tax=Sphingobium sp. Sx8-8 TaxID=2933617 RepID=UPI001F56553C|nr:alpha/beta fold hydrolase [Sphingobium sp. Sx8-8]